MITRQSEIDGFAVDFEVEVGHLLALVLAEVLEGDLLAGEEPAQELLRNALGVLAVRFLKLLTHVPLKGLLLHNVAAHLFLIL